MSHLNYLPGYEIYRDVDGNGKFEEGKDETIVGNPHPDFEFGFHSSFRYKNFDLSFLINGVVGNDIFNAMWVPLTYEFYGEGNGLKDYYKNSWRGPGTTNRYPRNYRWDGREADFRRVSTAYIEDGSYVRLRNITLGYSIPFKKSFPVQLRIYVAGDNLVTLTNYSWFNPEVSAFGNNATAMGIDMGTYPAAKIYRFGVQLGF